MITDIFSRRYADTNLWSQLTESERRLLVQGFRMLDERLCPYYVDGKESDVGKAYWKDLQSRLSMELGLPSLSPLAYSYPSTWNGKPFTQTGMWTMHKVCENWYMSPLADVGDANRYILERLSLVEIGFRKREEQLKDINAKLDANVAHARVTIGAKRGTLLPGDVGDVMIEFNKKLNSGFQSAVDELNTRFQHAECPLHYHNGFIQISGDRLISEQIEAPFWQIVSGPKWANVDIDMKEAIDRRDTAGRDPAFYAARALESTIKIISGEKGWTHGGEKGAHNFIDNLASKHAGYLVRWEAEFLKAYFTNIRNPLGHGPGNQPMPVLSAEQTTFAIEEAMAWIKSLIDRSSL